MVDKLVRQTSEAPVLESAVPAKRVAESPSMEVIRSEAAAVTEVRTPSYIEEAKRSDPALEARLSLDEATSRLAALRADTGAGDAAVAEAVQAQSAAYSELLLELGPEEQATFMEMGGASMASEIMSVAGSGDPELRQKLVGDLVRAGEALGQGNVALLASAIGDAPAEVLAPALRLAIQQGEGALLAVALADQERGNLGPGDFNLIGMQVDSALAVTTGGFRDASAEVTKLRRDIVAASVRMRSAGIGEAEIKAFEEQVRSENSATFEAYERDAAIYASTLDGLSLDARGEQPGLSEGRFDLVDSLALSEAGGQAAAEALLKAGRGEQTWLDGLRERGDLNQSLIEHLYTQGAMQGVGALTASGGVDEMATLLRGVEQFAPEGTGSAVESLRIRVEDLASQGLSGEELRQGIARVFGESGDLSPAEEEWVDTLKIGSQLGSVAAAGIGLGDEVGGLVTGQGSRFGRISGAFSLLGNGLSLASADDGLDVALAGAGIGADVLGLAGRLGARASVGVGTLFSVIQAGQMMAEGNNEAAAVALLPAIGATLGGVIGVFAGGAGAVPGAAIGSAIGTGASIALEATGFGEVDGGETLAVPAITAALQARGVGSGPATELAEWFGADDASGTKFGYAAQNLGMDVEDLVLRVSKLPPEYREQFLYQVQRSVQLGKDGSNEGDAEGYRAFERALGPARPPKADSGTDEIAAYLASLNP